MRNPDMCRGICLYLYDGWRRTHGAKATVLHRPRPCRTVLVFIFDGDLYVPIHSKYHYLCM